MHVIVEGMIVRCVYPVNGLRYNGRYRVMHVLTDDMFYAEPPVVVADLEGVPAIPSTFGYFPWRFIPEATT